jgi:ATP-dependent DNA ligase
MKRTSSASRLNSVNSLPVGVPRELLAKSAILDGEIVASDAAGIPDFWRLFLRSAKPAELQVWAFDLLAMNGKDLRKWSLEGRLGYRPL